MKMYRRVLYLSLVAFATSCGRQDSANKAGNPFPGSDATGVVARVQGEAITAQQFQRMLLERGGSISKERLLEEVVRERALVARARAAGYDHKPELIAAFESMLAARFQKDEMAKQGAATEQISEAQIEETYRHEIARYTTPAQARAGVIFLAVGAKATAETRTELEQRAGTIRVEATKADATGYAQLVQRHSEDQATRYIGGDTGWLVRKDDIRQPKWEPAVVEMIFSLTQPGELAPVISTDRGFYIVRLTDVKPEQVRPLAEVQDGIRYQLTQMKQHQMRLQFFDEAKRGAQVEVNQSALDSIVEPPNRAARQPPPLPGG